MENEKKKTDYWQVVFIASMAGVNLAFANLLKDVLAVHINGVALAAIVGALGALIGTGIYALVKNRKTTVKIIVYIGTLILMSGTILFLSKLNSDSYIIKRNWNVIKNGNMSFEYPFKFSEMNVDVDVDIAEMKVFADGKEDRFAVNLIYDFKSEAPNPEDSLSGSILSSLASVNATDIEWIDSEFYENAVTAKVKYKIENNERIGFGIVYFKDLHYELASFLPYSKDYSEDFLNKIVNSISIEE